ncbi:hypothetical protein ACQ89H_35960, partial [Streptomyces lividans]
RSGFAVIALVKPTPCARRGGVAGRPLPSGAAGDVEGARYPVPGGLIPDGAARSVRSRHTFGATGTPSTARSTSRAVLRSPG